MNNYCTNCGKKLNPGIIKCDSCGTYVVDLQGENNKKALRIIIIIITCIVLGIILSIVISVAYQKIKGKSLKNKYLKEYTEAKFIDSQACRECTNSCDGSCISTSRIRGCHVYSYKSNISNNKKDLYIIDYKGDISIDEYSYIIHKHGFTEVYEVENYDYPQKRLDVSIKVNDINNELSEIYEMTNELIESYHKEEIESFSIILHVNIKENNEYIRISNKNMTNKSLFTWEFPNGVKRTNPSLEQINNAIEIYKYSTSKEEGTTYND